MTSVFARHRLPASVLNILFAGQGSPAVTAGLWQSEFSRRLLELHAVHQMASKHPDLMGTLPSADGAWQVLVRAQAVAPDAVRSILLHPQVGSWAAYALRRKLGGATSDVPIWVDFGGIHAVALTAAAAAGIDWQTRLPARAGRVMLPTLGMASFPPADDHAVVTAETGDGAIRLRLGPDEVTVPDDPHLDGPGWWGLRRLSAGGDLPLTVWLDDLDPFRDLADPVPPVRLTDAEVARWDELLSDAWRLLLRDHRPEAEALTNGVTSLVPLSYEEGWGTRSASTGEAFGSVMVSPPPDAVTLAVSLLHEFQHIKLGALIHLLPLNGPDDGSLHYAPWRDDPRPLAGLLQGVYAFFGIAAFWQRHWRGAPAAERSLAAFEYAYARAQTRTALRVLEGAAALTRDGAALLAGLSARSGPWQEDEVPAEVLRLAGLAIDGHRTGWRLRHRRPDAEQVDVMVTAWLDGEAPAPAPVPARTVPDPEFHWHQRIPALARHRAAGSGQAGYTARPVDPARPVAAADTLLVAGDSDRARDGYLAAIAGGFPAGSPEAVHAWTGLALAVSAAGTGPASRALLDRPDLVRELHRRLAAAGSDPDPIRLANWIGAALAAPEPVRSPA